jgi:hypothetical protein
MTALVPVTTKPAIGTKRFACRLAEPAAHRALRCAPCRCGTDLIPHAF